MADPFAHGMPVGDDHMWVDPSRLGCQVCQCCSVRLCQRARDRGTSCWSEADDHGDFDMKACPCAPHET